MIQTQGTVMLQCLTSKQKSDLLQFHVVDKNVKSLLGLPDFLEINLISLKDEVHEIDLNKNVNLSQEIFTEYADLFDDELGTLPVTYSMKINPDITPVVQPPRRKPVAMCDKVEVELLRSHNTHFRAHRVGVQCPTPVFSQCSMLKAHSGKLSKTMNPPYVPLLQHLLADIAFCVPAGNGTDLHRLSMCHNRRRHHCWRKRGEGT